MLPIQKLFSANEGIFKINFEDMPHEDSLKGLYNCNSANRIPGLPLVVGKRLNELYTPGAINPNMSKAARQETLKKLSENPQTSLIQCVDKLKDENLLEELTFLGFHEAYHLGQIGLIRKLFGKDGAIE